MCRIGFAIGLLSAIPLMLSTAAGADLKQYVRRPDESYAYRVVGTHPVGPTTAYLVRMTSQTWRGIEWKHWLSLLVPERITRPDQAVLMVVGGDNGDGMPDHESTEARLLAQAAHQSGSIVAVLQQVPNQPLFDGLREDNLISYTFARFLESGEADWPALLPMVKSAVRAMDTVQAVAEQRLNQTISRFVVSGASKRGWTTWLTAAADPRVGAIAPMVIDMLNVGPQMRRQLETYGTYSRMIREYEQRGVIQRMNTPRGRRLAAIVDPFRYRDALRMPKLVVLGTNDPYWTVDAANLYFSQLHEPAQLHYAPNAGHGLSPEIAPTLLRFFRDALSDEPLPEIRWHRRDEGSLVVQWDGPGAAATLWQAHSPDRDFRRVQWRATPLSGAGRVEVNPLAPDDGWLACFVQVTFHGEPSYTLSTTMIVLPETFPHEPPQRDE